VAVRVRAEFGNVPVQPAPRFGDLVWIDPLWIGLEQSIEQFCRSIGSIDARGQWRKSFVFSGGWRPNDATLASL
jgi:hypothetical protein